jgi:hypothetical protein
VNQKPSDAAKMIGVFAIRSSGSVNDALVNTCLALCTLVSFQLEQNPQVDAKQVADELCATIHEGILMLAEENKK